MRRSLSFALVFAGACSVLVGALAPCGRAAAAATTSSAEPLVPAARTRHVAAADAVESLGFGHRIEQGLRELALGVPHEPATAARK